MKFKELDLDLLRYRFGYHLHYNPTETVDEDGEAIDPLKLGMTMIDCKYKYGTIQYSCWFLVGMYISYFSYEEHEGSGPWRHAAADNSDKPLIYYLLKNR